MKKIKLLILFIIGLLLTTVGFLGLSGCQTRIITQEVKVPHYEPAIHDTIPLRDTLYLQDSLWYGEVMDSVGNVIGDLKVYYLTKIAELKLKSKVDTVTITDTDTIPGKVLPPEIIKVAVSYFSWWELTLIGLLISALISLKIKRGSILSLFGKK